MLSDEEKEAKLELNRYIYGKNLSKNEIVDYLGIIFTLIEKQQKEIEDNKKYIVQLTDEQYRKLVDIIRDEISKEWEDKIKAKIEELEKQDRENRMSHNYLVIPVLQSLLEKE